MNLFYRNRQLLFLTLTLIVVWGLSAFLTLPRLEDPEIVQRNASITTLFPGASAERVESLITDKIEEEFSDVEEISNIQSTSSPNISIVNIELKDTVSNVEPVWAKIRSQLEDVSPELPAGALEPEYEDSNVAANALIVGLTWDLDSPANLTVLQRVAQGLQDQLEQIPGTDKVEIFGQLDEEILVKIEPSAAARFGLTAAQISQQIQASDAKVSSGQLRSATDELSLEVDSALDSLERIRQTPIQIGETGQVSLLADVATVEKTVRTPAEELAIVSGKPAVVLSAQVESSFRVDLWAVEARQVLADFENELSDGLSLNVVLDQSQYVQQRLNGVIGNLLLSSALVILVSLFMLGWRSAVIVGLALPLATMSVFGCMKVLDIPLHQMSVTGLIIALGLLIDNAIVVVDEVQIRLRAGMHPSAAVSETVRHLIFPLGASTLTTILAFIPIATSPGGTGEFIGTIGTTVILALLSSLALSLTAIAALIGLLYRRWPNRPNERSRWWKDGFANRRLSRLYARSLGFTFRRPLIGIGLAMILPVVGFVQFAGLPQQFFPPTNRDQFQIEFEMPAQSAMALTQSQVLAARDIIREHPAISEVHWFIGKSAPSFFYNVVPTKENAPDYAQGLVSLSNTDNIRETIIDLQTQLDAAFPQAQVLVRQLEQGPPFPAPIELRLYGADTAELRSLGNQLRRELATLPEVIHTRATLAEVQPKLALAVDEVKARRAGLSNQAIATQLNATLDGAVGGSLLEDTEDISIRVRVGEDTRGNLSAIASTDLLTNNSLANNTTIPLSAVADINLVPDVATIARYDGERINTVQSFLTAGALPNSVLTQFEQRLEESGFELPKGYRIEYGGEADARGSAVGNLLASVGVLLILMVATLVLSFNSFAIAGLLGVVAISAVGLAAMALWLFNSIFGFTAILGTLGLIGLAINDSIVVLAALREDPRALVGDVKATVAVVMKATRHVAATTVTTIVGFVPLMLDKTGFWPPLAIAIAGGLGGATLLALYFIPTAHIWIFRRKASITQT